MRSMAVWSWLAVALLAGCDAPTSSTPVTSTPATPTPATPTPVTSASTTRSPAAGLSVTLVRSGGIAGVQDTIIVTPDGGWTRSEGRGTPQRAGRLTGDQAQRLRALLSDPQLAAEARRKPSTGGNCADTFVYTLIADVGMVYYHACPAAGGQAPEVTLEIADLLLQATRG